MGKKNKVFIAIRYILFITCLFFCVYVVNYILRDKVECANSATFNDEPADSIDVIFLGSSQVILGLQPMELWGDFGMASYNLATSATNIPVSYYAAKLAIEKQNPKLIVMDMSFINSDTKHLGTERVHQFLDNFNFSISKYQAVFDLIEPKDRLEMLFPFYIYHTRWKDLKEEDFIKVNDSNLKGAALYKEVYPMTFDTFNLGVKEEAPINQTALEYTMRLIDLCKENNTELLFIILPTVSFNEKQNMYLFNSLQKIADENQINLLNGYQDQGLWNLDYHTDFADPAHANVRGAVKITDRIGQYIESHYNIPDKRDNRNYQSWNTQYDQYLKYKDSLLSYPTYSMGTKLHFNPDMQANKYFVNGLVGPESDWTWSSGKQSDAFFYLDGLSKKENEKSHTLEFEISNLYLTETDSQKIEIYINDNYIGERSLKPENIGSPVSFSIQKDTLDNEGLNHLVIKYPYIQTDEAATIAVAWESFIIK